MSLDFEPKSLSVGEKCFVCISRCFDERGYGDPHPKELKV